MQLTRFTDLGLRLVMRLGASGAVEVSQRVTVNALASSIRAPETHVARVVARLVELEVASSVRGRNGGVFLTSTAPEMSVGKLARLLEGEGEVVNCIQPEECPFAKNDCLLRHRLAVAKQAFFESLDDLTIADLIADASKDETTHLGLPIAPAI